MTTVPRCLALFDRPGGIRSDKQLTLALTLLDADIEAGRISRAQAQVVRRAARLLRRAWKVEDRERRATI
jgi:hypothetical protein